MGERWNCGGSDGSGSGEAEVETRSRRRRCGRIGCAIFRPAPPPLDPATRQRNALIPATRLPATRLPARPKPPPPPTSAVVTFCSETSRESRFSAHPPSLHPPPSAPTRRPPLLPNCSDPTTTRPSHSTRGMWEGMGIIQGCTSPGCHGKSRSLKAATAVGIVRFYDSQRNAGSRRAALSRRRLRKLGAWCAWKHGHVEHPFPSLLHTAASSAA